MTSKNRITQISNTNNSIERKRKYQRKMKLFESRLLYCLHEWPISTLFVTRYICIFNDSNLFMLTKRTKRKVTWRMLLQKNSLDYGILRIIRRSQQRSVHRGGSTRVRNGRCWDGNRSRRDRGRSHGNRGRSGRIASSDGGRGDRRRSHGITSSDGGCGDGRRVVHIRRIGSSRGSGSVCLSHRGMIRGGIIRWMEIVGGGKGHTAQAAVSRHARIQHILAAENKSRNNLLHQGESTWHTHASMRRTMIPMTINQMPTLFWSFLVIPKHLKELKTKVNDILRIAVTRVRTTISRVWGSHHRIGVQTDFNSVSVGAGVVVAVRREATRTIVTTGVVRRAEEVLSMRWFTIRGTYGGLSNSKPVPSLFKRTLKQMLLR